MKKINSLTRLLSHWMNSIIPAIFVCIFLLLPCLRANASMGGWNNLTQNDSVKVMFVHSLSDDHPFYRDQNEALEDALSQCSRPVQIIHKYLNCRFWGKEEEYIVCQNFSKEARRNDVDIILCEGDQALYSMLHCGDSLSHKLPFFYNGTCINGPKLTDKFPNVKGCQAPIDYEEMFTKMLKLFPERNKFVILRDRRLLSRKASAQFKKDFNWAKQFNPKLELLELDVEDSEFKSNYYKIRSAALQNILVIPYWGEIFYPIFREMQAPIVSFQPEALRENIFAVYAPNRKELGSQLGVFTAQYIDAGMQQNTPLVFEETDYHWSCDFRQLKRFDLHISDFPKDTLWINKPLDRRVRILIVCALVAVFSMLIISIIMLFRRYRLANNERLVSETRAEAQKQLLIQRQHYADVLAHEHLGIVAFDTNGDITFTNECADEILDITEEEKKKMEAEHAPSNIYDICSMTRGVQTNVLARLSGKISEQHLEVVIPSFTYLNVNKTSKRFRISGMLRHVVDGNTPLYLLTIKRMTDEDIKDELSNLSVDIHRVYPFVYDFMTDAYHFTGAQPSYMRHLHNASTFTLDEVMPFVHVDDAPGMKKQVDSTFDEVPIGKTFTLVYRALNNQNQWEWFENRFRILQIGDAEDSLIGIGICQSIQDKKEREAKLMEARDKAKEADILKTAFLANMSHEIRTPLNSIVGFSSLLNHMEEYTQEEITEYIHLINKNCDMLLSLIGDVLELAKIESGSMDFKIGAYPLHSIMEEVMKSQKINPKDGVEFVCKKPPHIKDMPDVHVDPLRLRQLLHNLLNNSKKFTKTGRITLGCDYTLGNETYMLFVEDTGIGMSEEQCANIFQRFYKADSFTQGAGLGLSICQTIVERMGGEISVASKRGKGTRFEIVLPICTE